VLAGRAGCRRGRGDPRQRGAGSFENYVGTSSITRQSASKTTVLARRLQYGVLIDALTRQAFTALIAA
jgi:hypothetical protein